MEVTASGQDVRKAQKYLTLLWVKGPSILQLVPPCSHLLTLPTQFTSPRHPSSPSPSPTPSIPPGSLLQESSRNVPSCEQSESPGLALSEVPDHFLPVCLHYLSEIAKCRQQGPSFRYLCRTTGHAQPSPAHHQPRATYNMHLTKMHD